MKPLSHDIYAYQQRLRVWWVTYTPYGRFKKKSEN